MLIWYKQTMDVIGAMAAFVRVAERGSFTLAARDLGVSQPHVTRALQTLEARLAAQLVQRTTRRLVLTDDGRAYLERCRAILASIEEADQAVGRGAASLRGELRVFAPVSLGRSWIVPRLGEFMDRHPELSVRLVLDDRPRDLIEERLDVGVRVGPLPPSSYRARKLGDVERVIVGSAALWQRYGEPRAPEDLEAVPWLIYDGTIRVDRVTCVRGRVSKTVAMRGRFSTNSSEAIEEALLCGQGACLAPYWLVSRHLQTGRLVRVLGAWSTPPTLPILALFPLGGSAQPTAKVRRFLDWLAWSFYGDGLFVGARPRAQSKLATARRPRARSPAGRGRTA